MFLLQVGGWGFSAVMEAVIGGEIFWCVIRSGDSQYYFLYKLPYFCYLLTFYICNFWFVSCPEIYLWKKIYLVNRLERNCRQSLIPFHAIWGLCWIICAELFQVNTRETREPKTYRMQVLVTNGNFCGKKGGGKVSQRHFGKQHPLLVEQ